MHSHSFPLSFFALLVLQLCSVFPALVTADVKPFNNSVAYAEGKFGNYTRQQFLSDRSAVAPVANVFVEAQPGVSPSKYVVWSPVGPYLPEPDAHPMILDAETLSLVWFGPRHDLVTMGPYVQSCNGTEYITFWSGFNLDSRPAGHFYMVSTSQSAFSAPRLTNVVQ